MIGPAGACLALVLAGCGADGPAATTPARPAPSAVQRSTTITPDSPIVVNKRTERSFERAAGYCAAKLAGKEPTPSASRIRNEVNDLITLERTDPGVQVAFSDESLSAALRRVASTLRPCEPTLADELDLAATALPVA